MPRISSLMGANGKEDARLHILPNEPSGGRPVGPQVCTRHSVISYASVLTKLPFSTGTAVKS